MKSRNIIYIFTLALFVQFSGCSSGGDDSPQVVIPLDTSEIRSYQQGDSVTYNIALRHTSTGQTITGTVTMAVSAIVQNPFGIDCRSTIDTFTLTGPSGTESFTDRSLFYQDASGSLYDCGDFDDTLGRYVFLTDTPTSPNGIFLYRKSPVQVGDATSGVMFYDDGSWEDCTETVQAIENISVPIGLYESYKINVSCSESDGTTTIGTDWLVPSIFDIKGTYTEGVLTGDLVITDYTLN